MRMFSLKKYIPPVLLCLSSVFLGFMVAFVIYRDNGAANTDDQIFADEISDDLVASGIVNMNEYGQTDIIINEDLLIEAEENMEEEIDVDVQDVQEVSLSSSDITITSNTKMVYEYYYKDDGCFEKAEELPPKFLIDKTEKYLADTFSDWSIILFTPDEVVMRKELDQKSNQHYIVGVYEGLVAVFYQEETNGTTLKEITDTPVNALSESEQLKLGRGIAVTGNEALFKILEGYGP